MRAARKGAREPIPVRPSTGLDGLLVRVVSASIAISVVFHVGRYGPIQPFARDAAIKRVALPVIVAIVAGYAVTALVVQRRRFRFLPMDRWLLIFLVVVGGSLLVQLLTGSGYSERTVIQDVGLGALFFSAYAAGRLAAMPASRAAPVAGLSRRTLAVCLFASVLVMYGSVQLSPFATIIIASGFAAIATAWRSHSVLIALVGASLLVRVFFFRPGFGSLGEGVQISSSSLYQLSVGAAISVFGWFFFYRRRRRRSARPMSRKWVLAGLLLGAIYLSATPGVAEVHTLQYQGRDIPLLARQAEAHEVLQAVGERWETWLFGRGPGATISLISNPDRFTYQLRGQADVEDVHLLVYQVLLKLGVAGLLWLTGFVALVASILRRSVSLLWPGDAFLIFTVALGLVDAISAATHLFADPLFAIALGGLVSKCAHLDDEGYRVAPSPIRTAAPPTTLPK